MPFVRLSLLQGKSPAYLKQLADSVHEALVEAFEVPPDDRFQVIHQHMESEFYFDAQYLGIQRSRNQVFIGITAGRARSTTTKTSFYRCLTQKLSDSLGLRPEDVMVTITMNTAEDWSFGCGVAQMLGSAPVPGHLQEA
ncbi:tautomerase family protein [Deinococcus hopiensis]|uniref:Phenylpyruvate tautomerase PptA, 4-oxalocrotonate tautomerase family n=1 Tax=Deinococcus hopiensis KR-140 TaxID=695939 RepID=A0A1W1UQ17_9DEIO|nr:tautomerase family protein [Deinococcus hopiensis]SMB83187.1 Phenylpyruvate tautomerase PptA, 4-oxalocrotonate tautomerase family [Deinococcus hopiensis KR-140]